MQNLTRLLSLMVVTVVIAAAALTAIADEEDTVDVARFSADGRLHVPENMDEWVFLGSSLGMGYSQDNFDPDSPGMFQIARMEPNAYKVFVETGEFPDGTMLSLHFYGSEDELSTNRAGFVMGDLHFSEIHYKNSERFPDGFNFYNVNNGDTLVEEIALPNECVDCHKRDGAYDGVFVQFYPPIYDYLPEAVQQQMAREQQPADAHAE